MAIGAESCSSKSIATHQCKYSHRHSSLDRANAIRKRQRHLFSSHDKTLLVHNLGQFRRYRRQETVFPLQRGVVLDLTGSIAASSVVATKEAGCHAYYWPKDFLLLALSQDQVPRDGKRLTDCRKEKAGP